MSSELPTIPPNPPPATSLALSASTPHYLSSAASQTDSISTWAFHEQLFLACIRTQDHRSARLCLQRLSDRFGASDDRVLGLVGILDEASAEGDRGLEGVLKGYNEILEEDPTRLPIEKRRVAVLKSLGRRAEAITRLRTILEYTPTDAESWGELSRLYFDEGLYAQSIYCLEEIVLLVPNAYNIFARLGEVAYVAGRVDDNINLAYESLRYYCRSLELCDGYLRAFYGLLLSGRRALELLSQGKKGRDGYVPKQRTVERLVEMAVHKLGEIVSNSREGRDGWTGYDEGEVQAAAQLLDEVKGDQVR